MDRCSRGSTFIRIGAYALVFMAGHLFVTASGNATELYWVESAVGVGSECYNLKHMSVDQSAATPNVLSYFCSTPAFADPNPAYGALAIDDEFVYLRSWYVGTQAYWSIPRAGGDAVPTGVTPRIGIALNEGALDETGVDSYWGEPEDGLITKGNAIGENRTPLVAIGSYYDDLFDISLDTVHDKLYWAHTDSGGPLQVFRSNLDGSSMEQVGQDIGADDFPVDIDIDAVENKVFLMSGSTGSIYRLNTDGTDIETLVSSTGVLFSMVVAPSPVPEPSSAILVAASISSVLATLRRRHHSDRSRRFGPNRNW